MPAPHFSLRSGWQGSPVSRTQKLAEPGARVCRAWSPGVLSLEPGCAEPGHRAQLKESAVGKVLKLRPNARYRSVLNFSGESSHPQLCLCRCARLTPVKAPFLRCHPEEGLVKRTVTNRVSVMADRHKHASPGRAVQSVLVSVMA